MVFWLLDAFVGVVGWVDSWVLRVVFVGETSGLAGEGWRRKACWRKFPQGAAALGRGAPTRTYRSFPSTAESGSFQLITVRIKFFST